MNNKKTLRSSAVTALLLVAALLLLAFSGTQTAKAALTYYSETYSAQVNVFDIGITLVENGADISHRDYTQADDAWSEHTGVLLAHMLDAEPDKTVKLGKSYPEALAIRNSGNTKNADGIDEYVRVKVRCYWFKDTNGNGQWDNGEEKVTTVSPGLIGLNLVTGTNGWLEDKTAATAEQHVLYYNKILKYNETTPSFTDTLTISDKVAKLVSTSVRQEGNTIITTYDYDGLTFQIEAEGDAVQTHNAADAIKSAWGVNVNIAADGSLSLA